LVVRSKEQTVLKVFGSFCLINICRQKKQEMDSVMTMELGQTLSSAQINSEPSEDM
jgi:hypothetical protein